MDSDAPSQGNVGASNEVAPEIILGQAASGMSQMSKKPSNGKMFITSEETVEEYDKLRLVFIILLSVAGLFGLLALVLLIGYHCEVAATEAKNTHQSFDLYPWKETSSLHQILMMFFGVILQGIAVNVYRIFPFTFNRYIVKLIHFGLNALVGIGMIVGLLSIYSFKDSLAKKMKSTPVHFFSQHGWAGIISIPCFLAQLVGGTVFFLLPVVPIPIRAAAMPFHKAGGWFIYLVSCSTALMGFNNGYVAKSTEKYLTQKELLVRFAFLFLLFHVIIMLYLALAPQFKRRPRPE